jgi:nicotinate-nucleotide pyrophosphorylase (carboxylating)
MPSDLGEIVDRALREDLGTGDCTTLATVTADARGRGRIVARESLVACGIPVAGAVFGRLNPDVRVSPTASEGERVAAGAVLAEVEGPLRPILSAERSALNFVQRLSGIATWTRVWVDRLGGRRVRLVDTRKTTPGLRSLEKYAVRVGGAQNHRSGLYDGVMVKDNHVLAAGGVGEAVRLALAGAHHLMAPEIEVDSVEQAREAIAAGARVLLLDNFDLPRLRAAVAELRALRADLVLEASGGVTLERLPEIADTGVDVISCGALIHQSRWVDVALDLQA